MGTFASDNAGVPRTPVDIQRAYEDRLAAQPKKKEGLEVSFSCFFSCPSVPTCRRPRPHFKKPKKKEGLEVCSSPRLPVPAPSLGKERRRRWKY